jgi:hypothetical protein
VCIQWWGATIRAEVLLHAGSRANNPEAFIKALKSDYVRMNSLRDAEIVSSLIGNWIED